MKKERNNAMNNITPKVEVVYADWVPVEQERASDEVTYLKAHRERMARMHHLDEATDAELLVRWAMAKEWIKRRIAMRKQADRRRAALAQRVAAGAGLVLLALGWVTLLALLWG